MKARELVLCYIDHNQSQGAQASAGEAAAGLDNVQQLMTGGGAQGSSSGNRQRFLNQSNNPYAQPSQPGEGASGAANPASESTGLMYGVA